MSGANPALVVRIAGNLAELRANLAEGKNQIETTTAAMTKLATSFSGDRLIQQAHNVVAAVNEIGGASKLTEAEQARVNATVEKALEKYRLLGKEAPAGMQALADETRSATKEHTALGSVVKEVAIGFAALFTARAAMNFVTDVLQQASALKDLSQQTHINVEDLQLLAGAMSEFGVDADTLGKGLYKLSRGIAGGDESVTRGLHDMGMSLKDVEGLNGQELFLKIEHGLATLKGGLRDTAAAELFGGKLGAAMAGASEGIDGALADARRLNTVMSTASVDAMDKYGESIERAHRSLSAIAANAIGPVAEGFNVLNDAAQKGASKWSLLWATVKDFAASNSVTGASTSNLATLLDQLNQATERDTATTVTNTAAQQTSAAAIDERSQAVRFMAALEADAAVALSASQNENLAKLKEMGALNAQNAAAIGVSASQYAKYTAMLEQATKTLEILLAAEKSLQEFRDTAHVRQVEILKIQAAEQLKLAGIKNTAVAAELAAGIQLNAAHDRDAQGRLKVTSAAETLRIALEALHRTKVEGISQSNQEQVLLDAYTQSLYDEAVAQDRANATLGQVPTLATAASSAIDGITQSYWAMVDAAARAAGVTVVGHRAGEPGSEINGGSGHGMTGAGGTLSLSDGATDPRVIALMSFGYSLNEAIAMINGSAGHIAPTHRAGGGSVTAAMPYIVGERRPELFVPETSGTILPNVPAGGSVSLTLAAGAVQFHYPIMNDPRARLEIVNLLSDALMARLRAGGWRAPTGA